MAGSFADTLSGHTLDIDLSKTGKKEENLATLCTDLFLIVIRMRECEDLGKPDSLRKLIIHYIELFRKNCRSMDVNSSLIEEAVYSLVALLDETVLSVPGQCRDYWVFNPLQLELFGDNFAGEKLYQKLDALIKEPEKNKDILEIYYLCLCIGYEGKYRLGNAQERETIITNLARILLKTGKHTTNSLSPHGKRVVTGRINNSPSGKRIPLWITGLTAVAVLLIFWFIMFFITAANINNILSSVG